MLTECYAAGQRGTTAHNRVRSHDAVVGNMNLIIDLDVVVYDGVINRSAIDRYTCADQYIITDAYPSYLRNLLELSLLVRCDTESVCTNGSIRMNRTAFADLDIVVNHNVLTNTGMSPDSGVSTDTNVRAKFDTVRDLAVRTYVYIGSDSKIVPQSCG